jgi:hypothetical protein
MTSVLSQSATGGNVCLSQEYVLQKFYCLQVSWKACNNVPDNSQGDYFLINIFIF